jgi:hypothetical protein
MDAVVLSDLAPAHRRLSASPARIAAISSTLIPEASAEDNRRTAPPTPYSAARAPTVSESVSTPAAASLSTTRASSSAVGGASCSSDSGASRAS